MFFKERLHRKGKECPCLSRSVHCDSCAFCTSPLDTFTRARSYLRAHTHSHTHANSHPHTHTPTHMHAHLHIYTRTFTLGSAWKPGGALGCRPSQPLCHPASEDPRPGGERVSGVWGRGGQQGGQAGVPWVWPSSEEQGGGVVTVTEVQCPSGCGSESRTRIKISDNHSQPSLLFAGLKDGLFLSMRSCRVYLKPTETRDWRKVQV